MTDKELDIAIANLLKESKVGVTELWVQVIIEVTKLAKPIFEKIKSSKQDGTSGNTNDERSSQTA